MTLAEQLIEEANRAGLSLWLDGETVRWRGPRPSPELLARLKEHRDALRWHLLAVKSGLPADQRPWLHVAHQVLAGEFRGADRSLLASLTIGLRGVAHPRCRQALEALQAQSPRR